MDGGILRVFTTMKHHTPPWSGKGFINEAEAVWTRGSRE